MLDFNADIPVRNVNTDTKDRLVGYVLTARPVQPDEKIFEYVKDRCAKVKMTMECSETDCGIAQNPIRMGLWRALRRLVCSQCEPKKMSFSIMNFDDFLYQALLPCHCGSSKSLDGIAVSSLRQISDDQGKGTKFVLRLAQMNKHLIADDGICLSCCHPAAKAMLKKALS